MHISMTAAKKNFDQIFRLLENGKEEYIVITKYGKPLLRITLNNNKDVSKRFGIGKGLFEIPDDFDDWDIYKDFDGEIYPDN